MYINTTEYIPLRSHIACRIVVGNFVLIFFLRCEQLDKKSKRGSKRQKLRHDIAYVLSWPYRGVYGPRKGGSMSFLRSQPTSRKEPEVIEPGSEASLRRNGPWNLLTSARTEHNAATGGADPLFITVTGHNCQLIVYRWTFVVSCFFLSKIQIISMIYHVRLQRLGNLLSPLYHKK